MSFLKKVPMWGWLLGGGVILAGAYYMMKKKQVEAAQQAAAMQAQADASQQGASSYQPTGQPLYPLGPVGGSPGIFMPPSGVGAQGPQHIDITLPDPHNSHPLTGGGAPGTHPCHHKHPHDKCHKRHRHTTSHTTGRGQRFNNDPSDNPMISDEAQ